MQSFYQLSSEEVFKYFKTSASGLKNEIVQSLQAEYGRNVLQEGKRKSKLSILASQFKDVMILILIIAAGISFSVGEHTDGFVILAIIIGNAWIGYSQEYHAEESVRMLQKMSAQYALVMRGGHPLKIEASEIVPGDILLLEAGDIVPADARLFEAHSFKTDEASLTGESHSIDKNPDAIPAGGLVAGDQNNMVFKGTIVSNGTAKGIVTATGMETELGKIAGMMEIPDQKTPLQLRLALFSKQLAIIVILICLVVFGYGLWRGEPPFEMFLTALSLAVAALPEALPAVITIALAQGANRMVRQNALMRRLPAVETLGSVTFICSDKTGTLTQNVMTVEKVDVAEGKEKLLGYAMMLNNEVRISEENTLIGDSTETALVQFAEQQGHSKKEAEKEFLLQGKLPFDSVRMRMSTFHQYDNQWILFVKGAPAKILEVLSKRYDEQVQGWREQNQQWAADGLRVLFFAFKIFDQKPEHITPEFEKDLDFLGMAALIDPPREEVIEALKLCKTAGIKTVMITGDQALTAKAIAERLQMFKDGADAIKTGADLDKLDQDELSSIARHASVYARVSPEQKLKIVKALQNNGEFVAMTGDGVNDAPSLKQANIGVAMGITGTDVSKEAADMILLDDNFATIVKAIREGRRIYENIRKFILYVLSCNLGEILTIFFGPVLGFAIPLLPTHILWINLVTDGLPGLALVAEPAEKDIMNRPPRPPKENLFAGGMTSRILFTGTLMAISALFIQWWVARLGYEVRTQQTAVFSTLCFVQLGNALSVRNAFDPMLSAGLFRNHKLWISIMATVLLQVLIIYVPFLNAVLKTTSLSWDVILTIILTVLICLTGIETQKFFHKRQYFKKNAAG